MDIHKINEDGTITPYKKMPVARENQIENFLEKYPDENPQGCVELRIDIAKVPQLSQLLS